jgi:glutamate/tyrosine decarboxylase-like PLP-dependent enzyme
MQLTKTSPAEKLKRQIQALEPEVLKLETEAAERAKTQSLMEAFSESFLADLPTAPAYFGDHIPNYDSLVVQEVGSSMDKLIRVFEQQILPSGINAASGGHLGYIPGGGVPEGAWGDYLAALSNRYAGVYFASPAAVKLENALISWAGQQIGYTGNFGGNLTTGGSIANLMALAAAKFDYNIKGPDLHKHVVYLTEQTHHCIPKALRVTALDECEIRYIPLDEYFRIIPGALENLIKQDKNSGLRPFLIIASAGTTDTGAVDPLDALADIADMHQLWLHVDGAYGGFFVLTEQGKELMKGIERADSVIMDPHKSLFLPYGLGMVLVKDAMKLLKANTFRANYMQDTFGHEEELSPADMSIELTKHFRGMRMWLPLKYHGVDIFRKTLDEKLLLAQYAHAKLNEEGFEIGPEPQLSVLFFRYTKHISDPDSFNRNLLAHIHQDGRIFISSTRIKRAFYLRLAILSFRTRLYHIDLLIKIMKDFIGKHSE